jgi:tetratricopeptide (TPR) repeat protein
MPRLHRFILVALACTAAALPACRARPGTRTARADRPRPAASLPPKAQAEHLLTTAEESIRRGNTERALTELARAIELNPRLARAHMDIADIHRTEGDYADAQVAYRNAALLEPDNFDAQYYDGLMLHLLNRVTEAIGAYLRALRIRPDDLQANLKLAVAYYQLDETTQALAYARRAVSLSPTSGEARFQLGAIYAAMNDHAGAVKELQQATELMELTPRLLLALAESLGKLERYTEMRNAVERVVKTQPSAAAWERLGFADFKLYAEATRRQDAAEAKLRFDLAEADFRAALKLDPDYYPALNGLGVCRLNRWILSDQTDRKARDEGVEALRRSIRLNADQPRVIELLTRYGK